MTLNPPGDNNPAPDTEREPGKESDHAKPPASNTSTKSKSQPTHPHYQITYKTENNWWDKTKPFLEIAAAILLAIYTGYTIKMYYANKQAAEAAKSAADSARLQLELSERPWVHAQISIGGPLT